MLKYVNHLGEPITVPPPSDKPKSPKKQSPDKFHKGWRVVGVMPGAAAEAEREHNVKMREATRKGKPMAPFSLSAWLLKARKKAVRSKPYELQSAAQTCAELAAKAGWLGVELREISKGKE